MSNTTGEIYEKRFTFLTALCRAHPRPQHEQTGKSKDASDQAFQSLRPAGQHALANNLRVLPCKERNKAKPNLGKQTCFENRIEKKLF